MFVAHICPDVIAELDYGKLLGPSLGLSYLLPATSKAPCSHRRTELWLSPADLAVLRMVSENGPKSEPRMKNTNDRPRMSHQIWPLRQGILMIAFEASRFGQVCKANQKLETTKGILN